MTLFSVDPGMTGAILFRSGQSWQPVRMPALKVRVGKGYRSELDLSALSDILRQAMPAASGAPEQPETIERAADPAKDQKQNPGKRAPRGADRARKISGLLERQAPHRGQGFFGGASIMQSYGCLQGMLHALAIPYATIDPQSWRKTMKLGQGKEKSWLLLGRECPELAAQVKGWPLESRIAVADCYCMQVAGERQGLLASSEPEADWLA